ncbi:MAG: alpha/beta hydrolase [candidate division KSB1 bacterium]|nr:alpha/beta hydrolase [candidate division KSB1 bacterium]MDZ7302823.1 alpha/beta hydrolase [candidate division KSB1 bacterium]MDZ7311840.1 alpha/beta hydrolase [candidate division KSB1 bacterium]
MIQERFLMFTAMLCIGAAALAHEPGVNGYGEAEGFTTQSSKTAAGLQNGNFKVRLNNVEISYTIAGSGPVIMVHGVGWGLDSRLYQSTLKFLEAQYTLVYIDPRGTGDTMPITEPAQISSDLMVDDLEALRQHLGLNRIMLMGHAHGGFIAMKYALKYPSRLAQLILVDCILLRNLEEDIRAVYENLQRHPRRKDPGWEAALAGFKNEYEARTVEALQENLHTTAILYFGYYSPYQRANFEKAIKESRLSINNFNQFVQSDLLQYNLDGQESRISAPTLLIYGLYDPYFIRPIARSLHFAIRNSKLELFERSGHYPWIEEPQHFAEVLKIFLNPPPAAKSQGEKPTPQQSQ